MLRRKRGRFHLLIPTNRRLVASREDGHVFVALLATRVIAPAFLRPPLSAVFPAAVLPISHRGLRCGGLLASSAFFLSFLLFYLTHFPPIGAAAAVASDCFLSQLFLVLPVLLLPMPTTER